MIRVSGGDFAADELLDFAVHVGYEVFGVFEMDFVAGEVFPLLQSHFSGGFRQIFNKFIAPRFMLVYDFSDIVIQNNQLFI